MTQEIIPTDTESFDQDGNIIDREESSESGVVDNQYDQDGNLIMTARIESSRPQSYSLDIYIPTEEDKERERKSEIYRKGLTAARNVNTVTTEQIVNGHLPEGSITARTSYGQPISLSKAGESDLVKLPVIGETEAAIAETLGYIRRNPNTGVYEQVEEPI